MKIVRRRHKYILLGRGSTEIAAWAMAKRLSATTMRDQFEVAVYHPLHGDYHLVRASQGRGTSHQYGAGEDWWDTRRTVAQRAADAKRDPD